MIKKEDYPNPQDYLNARIEAGEVCTLCHNFLFHKKKGYCTPCKKLVNNPTESVSHSKFIRCNNCQYIIDTTVPKLEIFDYRPDTKLYRLTCPSCLKQYEVEIKKQITYISQPIRK